MARPLRKHLPRNVIQKNLKIPKIASQQVETYRRELEGYRELTNDVCKVMDN